MNQASSVRFDPRGPSVVIEHLTVDDHAVVAESRFWAQGHRGPASSSDELADADLSNYVRQALAVGANAIAAAGGVQQTYDLKDLVAEVSERTEQTSLRAVEATDAAIAKATKAMEAASTHARKAISEAGELARKDFSGNVDAVRRTLATEIQRVVGGENPELLARFQPLLDRFGRDLDERATKHLGELLVKVAEQFDPAQPTSVLAQQNRVLGEQHHALSEALTKQQAELCSKVDDLAIAVKVAHAARSAAAATAQLTPLKGNTYAESVHHVLASIAAGLGDDYADTSGVTGLVSRSKKGDGVLSVEGSEVRVAVEMSDSQRGSGWSAYLAEAERNRNAAGLDRTGPIARRVAW
jgi:hypothetical protein